MTDLTNFLSRSLALAGLVALTVWGVFYFADGPASGSYLRFTSGPQRALILGTSRAAQGVHPDVINAALQRNDLYNFSFTLYSSPYGPAYLDLVKRKLVADTTARGLFILTVDPWSVSVICEKETEDSDCLNENQLFTGQLTTVSGWPNLEYLLHHYDYPYYKLIFPKNENLFVQPNGRLEVTIQLSPEQRAIRTKTKLEDYEGVAETFRYSPLRAAYFREMIQYLKGRGEVYVVRLPVGPGMYAIEQRYLPSFQDSILHWTGAAGVPYLDLTVDNEQYATLDGHHLDGPSGERVSREIARFIIRERAE